MGECFFDILGVSLVPLFCLIIFLDVQSQSASQNCSLPIFPLLPTLNGFAELALIASTLSALCLIGVRYLSPFIEKDNNKCGDHHMNNTPKPNHLTNTESDFKCIISHPMRKGIITVSDVFPGDSIQGAYSHFSLLILAIALAVPIVFLRHKGIGNQWGLDWPLANDLGYVAATLTIFHISLALTSSRRLPLGTFSLVESTVMSHLIALVATLTIWTFRFGSHFTGLPPSEMFYTEINDKNEENEIKSIDLILNHKRSEQLSTWNFLFGQLIGATVIFAASVALPPILASLIRWPSVHKFGGSTLSSHTNSHQNAVEEFKKSSVSHSCHNAALRRRRYGSGSGHDKDSFSTRCVSATTHKECISLEETNQQNGLVTPEVDDPIGLQVWPFRPIHAITLITILAFAFWVTFGNFAFAKLPLYADRYLGILAKCVTSRRNFGFPVDTAAHRIANTGDEISILSPLVFFIENALTNLCQLKVLAFWAVVIPITLLALRVNVSSSQSKTSAASLTLFRKLFHFLGVVIFFPPICLVQPVMLTCSLFAAAAIFITMEVIRFSKFPLIGNITQSYVKSFLEPKDGNSLLLSPLYLLMGLGTPVVLETVRYISTCGQFDCLAASQGLLAVGVGDSAAAIIGTRYGRTRLRKTSNKTLEGLVSYVIAFLAASITFANLCSLADYYSLASCLCHRHWLFITAFTAVSTGCLEAFTLQNDNIIVPFAGYSIYRLLAFL